MDNRRNGYGAPIAAALWHVVIETLFYFPFVLLAHTYIFTVGLAGSVMLVLLTAAAGAVLAMFTPIRKQWFVHGAILIVSGAVAWLLYGGSLEIRQWGSWPVLYVAMFRGLQLGEWRLQGRMLFAAPVALVGLASYFVVSVLAAFGDKALRPDVPILLWCGFASVAVFMFMLNSHLLRSMAPAGNRSAASAAMAKNAPLLVVVFAVIIGVSFIRSIATAIHQAVLWIVDTIGRIMDWLTADTGGSGDAPPQQQPEQPQLPQGEASWWARMLEQLTIWLLVIGVAAVVIFLLYKLRKPIARAIAGLVRHLMRLLGANREVNVQDQGYTDERKKLLKLNELPGMFGRRVKDWLAALLEREPKWDDLPDNRARIRWLYRRRLLLAMRKGYAFGRHLTPRETAADLLQWERKASQPDDGRTTQLAELYDRARYGEAGSDVPVSAEQLEKLRNPKS